MSRRPPAALAVSCAALFFSLSGAGMAADHYLITSTRQLAPSVRRAFEARGPAGSAGAQGLTGTTGLQGAQGRPGPSGMVDWGDAVQVTSPPVNLDANATPVYASCPSADRALTGGFTGRGETVTASTVITYVPGLPNRTIGQPPAPLGWMVSAHLDPAAASGQVAAWVECVPAG